jgi:hypothetical protein
VRDISFARTGKNAANTITIRGWVEKMREEMKTGILLPQGFLVALSLYLIGQLVGGIWWAATLSANLTNLTSSIQTDKNEQKLKIQQLENLQQSQQQELQKLMVELGILKGTAIKK